MWDEMNQGTECEILMEGVASRGLEEQDAIERVNKIGLLNNKAGYLNGEIYR
jgi:hypothetical protein